MIELRPYQEECIKLALDAYRQNPAGRELVVLPCAAGKTVIFSHVIDALAQGHGTRALVVCHLDELLDQAAEKYRLIRPDAVIGKVGGGLHQYGAPLTVASIQTIHRPEHLKHLHNMFDMGKNLLIVLDEAHLSAAPSYQRVLAALPDAFVLMVTATPYRLDGKPVINKKPLYEKTILEMIEERYLCNLKAVAIKTEIDLSSIKTTAGDFNEQELDRAVNTPARNQLIVRKYQEHARDKRAICFGVTVKHAEALAEAFNQAGIAAASVTGQTPIPERKRLYRAFEHGDVLVLTSVNVLSIGFDSPRAEVAIMARPTQSQAMYVQQAGRILRLAPGKKTALLLDITDNSQRLRIMPQNIRRALKLDINDGETVKEAIAKKAEKQAKARRALIRKLNEKRDTDIAIDLFALPEWQERENGMYVLEVGLEKHRIALVPATPNNPAFNELYVDMYEVWARLAPHFVGQKWAGAQPLDDALQFAEKRARQLLADGSKLLDKTERWRNDPISEGQKKMLKWYHIPFHASMTKGQAADLIDEHKTMLAKRKAEKEARKVEKARMEA